MKKYLLLAFSFALVFTMTACGGGNKVTCSRELEEEGHKYTVKVVADLDGDKITGGEVVYTFETTEDADQFCEAMKQGNDKVSCSGKKVTMEGNAEGEGSSKDDFIKEAEAQGFKCN